MRLQKRLVAVESRKRESPMFENGFQICRCSFEWDYSGLGSDLRQLVPSQEELRMPVASKQYRVFIAVQLVLLEVLSRGNTQERLMEDDVHKAFKSI